MVRIEMGASTEVGAFPFFQGAFYAVLGLFVIGRAPPGFPRGHPRSHEPSHNGASSHNLRRQLDRGAEDGLAQNLPKGCAPGTQIVVA